MAGYRLRFAQARLEELNGTTLLVLTSAPFEGQHSNRWLTGLRLASVTAPDGRAVNLKSAFSYAGPDDQEGESPQARLAFDMTDPETGAVQPGLYQVAAAMETRVEYYAVGRSALLLGSAILMAWPYDPIWHGVLLLLALAEALAAVWGWWEWHRFRHEAADVR